MAKDWGNDDFVGGCLSLNFANTIDNRVDPSRYKDLLGTYGDIVSWARAAGAITSDTAGRLCELVTRHPRKAISAFERAISLRETIYRTFAALSGARAPSEHDIESICTAFADAGRGLSMVPTGNGVEAHWDIDPEDASSFLAPIALSASRLLLCGDFRRLKQCQGCGWLFLDQSKGGRRRWCDMKTCGNRAKVTRFRQKTR